MASIKCSTEVAGMEISLESMHPTRQGTMLSNSSLSGKAALKAFKKKPPLPHPTRTQDLADPLVLILPFKVKIAKSQEVDLSPKGVEKAFKDEWFSVGENKTGQKFFSYVVVPLLEADEIPDISDEERSQIERDRAEGKRKRKRGLSVHQVKAIRDTMDVEDIWRRFQRYGGFRRFQEGFSGEQNKQYDGIINTVWDCSRTKGRPQFVGLAYVGDRSPFDFDKFFKKNWSVIYRSCFQPQLTKIAGLCSFVLSQQPWVQLLGQDVPTMGDLMQDLRLAKKIAKRDTDRWNNTITPPDEVLP